MFVEFTHIDGYKKAINRDRIVSIEIDNETETTLIVLDTGEIVPVSETYENVLKILNQ